MVSIESNYLLYVRIHLFPEFITCIERKGDNEAKVDASGNLADVLCKFLDVYENDQQELKQT